MRFLLAATWVTDLKSNVSEAVNAYWQDLWQIFGEGEGPPPTNGGCADLIQVPSPSPPCPVARFLMSLSLERLAVELAGAGLAQ